MMRWNSTKTYTEEDMIRMQQEAVSRVHEFQTRAQQALPYYDVPESAITPVPSETPYVEETQQQTGENAPEQMAYSMPQESYDASVSQEQQPVIEAQSQVIPTPAPPAPTDPISGLLSKFNLDGETLLILGLMFLLYNEKADNVLLIALAYLLL